jgi:protease-4
MTQKQGLSAGCLLATLVTVGMIVLGTGALVLFVIVGLSSGEPEVRGDKIAQIDLEGIITSAPSSGFIGDGDSMVEQITAELKRAREDASVKAVVLRVNSPGGEVTAADTIYHHVKQTAAVKPVVVFMDSMAASGGFYVSCAATEVLANRTTMTGSIGVIISTMNYQTLFTKLGLESVVFTSGKFKDTLSGSRAMRPEEKELIQGMVNQTYERFLEVVKASRPSIPDQTLRSTLADGRILSGQDALASGLIDGVGYLEDAHRRAREIAKAPNARIVPYSGEGSFLEALGLMRMRARPTVPDTVHVHLGPGSASRFRAELEPGMMYLLPPHYAGF